MYLPTLLLALSATTLAIPAYPMPSWRPTSLTLKNDTIITVYIPHSKDRSLPTTDLPLPSDISSEDAARISSLAARGGIFAPNYCAANLKHFPTAKEYTRGYTQFCNNHAPTEIHRKSDGLVMTLTLNGFDKKPINWVYKVSVDDKMAGKNDDANDYSFTLTRDYCKEKFGSFLKGAGGGMPKVYCEQKTNPLPGDFLPIGHLVLGGKFSESLGSKVFGNAVYETRVKKGEKGIPFDSNSFDF